MMLRKPISREELGVMRVELDRRSLFALASDTRVEILRSLQPMRRTVSQLSETLSIDKAAVHRHLKKLEEGGLVKRYEDHGFVYYGLSWKARDLMTPGENTRIVITLASLLLTAVLAVAIALSTWGPFMYAGPATNSGTPTETGGVSGVQEEGTRALTDFNRQIVVNWSILLIPTASLVVVALFLAMRTARMIRRPRQRDHV